MTEISGEPQGDMTERMTVPIIANATLECSRFCLVNCGLYGDAQLQAVMTSAMISGEMAVADFDAETPKIDLEDGSEPQQIVMKCKGPRKKFVVAGELVCRKSASIDTI